MVMLVMSITNQEGIIIKHYGDTIDLRRTQAVPSGAQGFTPTYFERLAGMGADYFLMSIRLLNNYSLDMLSPEWKLGGSHIATYRQMEQFVEPLTSSPGGICP